MAIPLEGSLWWRRKAPFHLQLELNMPRDSGRVSDYVDVEGRVIRVFRTDGRVSIGDHIVFPLWVCNPGDEPTGPAYIYFDEFVKARFMEAYLHGDPPKCELAAYEFSVVSTPTDEPTLTVRQLKRLLRTRWWHYWKRSFSQRP